MKLITLSRGFNAIVDDKYFESLNIHKWHAAKGGATWYAVRNITVAKGRRRTMLMHREIMRMAGFAVEGDIDHCDMNGLNNQLANLRPATRSQNQFNKTRRIDNRSGFKGVNFCQRYGRWQARVSAGGTRRNLGYFLKVEDAAAAYAVAAKELHGEFIRLD